MNQKPSVRAKNLSELKDYIAFIVLYAPDTFPERRNLDLDSAFQQLFADISNLESKFKSNETFNSAMEMAHQSQKLYEAGNAIKGAHVLQDLMQGIRTNRA